MRTKEQRAESARVRRDHLTRVQEDRLVRLLETAGYQAHIDHESHTLAIADVEQTIEIGDGNVTVGGKVYSFRKRLSLKGRHLLASFARGFLGLPPPRPFIPIALSVQDRIRGRIRGLQNQLGQSQETDSWIYAKLDAYRDVLGLLGGKS